MTKKKAVLESLKNFVFESDETAETSPSGAAPATSAPIPPPPTTQWYAGAQAPVGVPVAPHLPPPVPVPPVSWSAPVPQEPDAKALERVKNAVFTEPSRYLHFSQMYETLGRPADVRVVINALQITDKSLTAESVIADATRHLSVLENFCAETDAEFASEVQVRIGAKDAEANTLIEANATAQAEIERHQREIAERTTALTQLATARAEDEAKIAAAKAKVDFAEDFVRNTLNSTISLLQVK